MGLFQRDGTGLVMIFIPVSLSSWYGTEMAYYVLMCR